MLDFEFWVFNFWEWNQLLILRFIQTKRLFVSPKAETLTRRIRKSLRRKRMHWLGTAPAFLGIFQLLDIEKQNIFQIYWLCISPAGFLFQFVFNPPAYITEVSFNNLNIPWGRFAVVVAAYVEGGVDLAFQWGGVCSKQMGQELGEAATSSKEKGGMLGWGDGGQILSWKKWENWQPFNEWAVQWNGGGVLLLVISVQWWPSWLSLERSAETISDFGSEQIWERSGEVWTSARHVWRVSTPWTGWDLSLEQGEVYPLNRVSSHFPWWWLCLLWLLVIKFPGRRCIFQCLSREQGEIRDKYLLVRWLGSAMVVRDLPWWHIGAS